MSEVSGHYHVVTDETHASRFVEKFISMIERLSLVDISIVCGNRSLRAHRIVLAANSPYFEEKFKEKPNTEQIAMGAVDFSVMVCLIEYMYKGKTFIPSEHFQYFKQVAKCLKIQSLVEQFSNGSTDDLYLPQPKFLTKKPRFCTEFTLNNSTQNATITKNTATVTNAKLRKPRQKITKSKSSYTMKSSKDFVPIQPKIPTQASSKANIGGRSVLKKLAEQVVRKESQTSRLALSNLKKQIGSTSQNACLIMEETIAKTCVKNIIPQTEENPTRLETVDHITKDKPNTNSFQPSSDEGRNQFEKGHSPTLNLENNSNAQNSSGVEIIYDNDLNMFVPVNKPILPNLQYQNGNQVLNGVKNNPSKLIPKSKYPEPDIKLDEVLTLFDVMDVSSTISAVGQPAAVKENPNSNSFQPSSDKGRNQFGKGHPPTLNLENNFNAQNSSSVGIIYDKNLKMFVPINKPILPNLQYQNGNPKEVQVLNGVKNNPSNLIPESKYPKPVIKLKECLTLLDVMETTMSAEGQPPIVREMCMDDLLPQTDENPTHLEDPKSDSLQPSSDEGQNQFGKGHLPTHNLENIFYDAQNSGVEITYDDGTKMFMPVNNQILPNLQYKNGNPDEVQVLNSIENKPSKLTPKSKFTEPDIILDEILNDLAAMDDSTISAAEQAPMDLGDFDDFLLL